ncbi:gamma-glutamylcyclotransferase [Geobacillus sp. C56-T2]|uniref:gamma-glutamylcyclotransferase n=1 Tax=Geobacillus sp. C56-T2 TaxID=600773 RepID=UPI0011AAFA43|nr:gamma-glutamylcyclotransferase [Geobacillus sp. C56-T2]NNV05092.1 gamma-glutamylcyclotransferase [Geobacillus sp. MMMUD3]TWG29798.1 gamma-glutamylcyclotransferase (GGCT)/AIG2-like uncharacterized protein YtfP [Geobacillus sp. C56-T2]
METINVFVYGTLRIGGRNHRLIANYVQSVRKVTVKGRLFHLPAGYPAMVDGNGTVHGEMFELSDPEAVLALLDQLEGYHGPGELNHYERITVVATDADGNTYTCYAYVYPQEQEEWLTQHAQLVFGGDWMTFLHSPKEVLYFAYGSCMSERDFRPTVPHFEVMGRAVLDDYRLAFTRYSCRREGGVADIVPSPGDRVEGVLYKIPEHYVANLDRREGVPAGVYRREYVDVQFHGQFVPALTYVVVDKQAEEIAPSASYAAIILNEGMSRLSRQYAEQVRRHIERLWEKGRGKGGR